MNHWLLLLLIVLSGLLAAVTSSILWLALPGIDRFARTLSPRREAYFWLVVGSMPLLASGFLLALSLLPAANLGFDHCLTHGGGHPHLCWRHAGGAPGFVLLFLGVAFAAKGLATLYKTWNSVRLSRATFHSLALISEDSGAHMVFESASPQAFVLGVWRPTLHVSSALLSLAPSIAEPVLAHERAHMRHQDFLWRALFPLLAVGHIAAMSKAISCRLMTAQEKAADAEAASYVQNPLLVAEAIIALSSAQHAPALALAFTQGDTVIRVRTLLGLTPANKNWPLATAIVGATITALLVAKFHNSVHHALEHVLGIIS